MKHHKYIGLFMCPDSKPYTLEVSCNGFLQAFFLLTADAIRSGRTYQLHSIESEDHVIKLVDNINICTKLLE
jgi:hypothetical protein